MGGMGWPSGLNDRSCKCSNPEVCGSKPPADKYGHRFTKSSESAQRPFPGISSGLRRLCWLKAWPLVVAQAEKRTSVLAKPHWGVSIVDYIYTLLVNMIRLLK